jgi:hypothetical protein
MRHYVLLSFAIAIALAVAGCTSNTASSTTIPTTPTAVTSTDAFSGTVGPSGTTGFPFTVSTTGTVTIGLTSVAPLSTMALGVGIATSDGTTCGSQISKNDNARSGTSALAGTATSGSYCVVVYDSGNVPDGWSVSFTVQVVHP